MKHAAAAVGLGMALWIGQHAPAQAQTAAAGEVRAIITAALRLPNDVIEQAGKSIGKKVVVEYGSARGNLKDKILNGEAFEIAILLPDVNEALFKAGKILPDTHEVGRVPIAFGLRGDAPVPDVSTPAAIKTAMLNAKSVKYSPTGAALFTVRKVLDTLAIADKIKDSSAVREEVALAPGEYEINVYPISEIIPNKKLKNLGAVTPALQVPAVLQAVISSHANDEKAARALIKFFQGSALDGTLKEGGMVKSVVSGTLK